MLDNGNYEEVISAIQHRCMESSHFGSWDCVEYGCDSGKLKLKFELRDQYEGGYYAEIDAKFCPFCGYKAGK